VFSGLHALALIAIALTATLLAWYGRSRREESVLVRLFGALAILEWVVFHTWKATPPDLRPLDTLPLQMCH